MTAPIAQTKAEGLIQSLNEMLHTGVDDLRLSEIESEADKMKSYGMLSDAYNVLGMVSSLRMDIKEVDRYFNAAIKHTGRDIDTLMNYAVALANAYQYRRAVEIVDEVLESAPGDAGVIRKAIDLHANSFDVEGARRLVDKLSQLGECSDNPITLGEHTDNLVPLDELDRYKEAFSAADTSWESVADRVGVAASAVTSVVKRPTVESAVHDGVVLFRFIVDATVEDAFRAESTMIETLANQQFSPADRVIYFSCGIT